MTDSRMDQVYCCHYSLVQFSPDPSRMETVNVGVVLICPREHFANALFTRADERVARLFRADHQALLDLGAAKQALANRIRHTARELSSETGLAHFASTRGNDLILTPPRPMRAEDPALALQQLFDELVLEPPH